MFALWSRTFTGLTICTRNPFDGIDLEQAIGYSGYPGIRILVGAVEPRWVDT